MCRFTRRVESAVYPVLYLAATFTLVLLSPGVLRAQTQSASSAQATHDARRAEIEARRRALWMLEKKAHRPEERRAEERLAYQQIKADFEMMQVTNYLLSDAVGSGSALDYSRISKEAAEVKKRASRLKANLSLPAPDKDEKEKKVDEGLTAEKLETAAADLNSLVQSFVSNPIFQQPNVVDMQQSAKAKRDLEGIIKLSEQIRKSAEALSKAAGKKS